MMKKWPNFCNIWNLLANLERSVSAKYVEVAWHGAISIKISLSLFTPTYFAVATSRSELKPTRTFTVMHEKFSPWIHMVLE